MMVGASLNLHLQYAEAEPILRDALAVATRVFGNDDVIVLDLARILARALRAQGNLSEADAPLVTRSKGQKHKGGKNCNEMIKMYVRMNFRSSSKVRKEQAYNCYC
jgi:hypothetical protein